MSERPPAARVIAVCAPGVSGQSEPVRFNFIELEHPRTGKACVCAARPGVLLEGCLFRGQHASWLVGDLLVADGGLHTWTPVDPLLFLLPTAASQPGSQEQERFREFDDFLQHAAASTSSAQRLTPYVSPAQVGPLCEVKSVDEDAYYRFSSEKIVAWLRCKARQALAALQTTCPQSLPPDARAAQAYAAGLIGDYLSSGWRHLLFESLGLTQDEIAPAAAAAKRQAAAAPVETNDDENKRPKVVEMTTKQKLAAGREKARLAAFSKDARGSSAISSFFRKP